MDTHSPSKRQRKGVDLSYVTPSSGTLFVSESESYLHDNEPSSEIESRSIPTSSAIATKSTTSEHLKQEFLSSERVLHQKERAFSQATLQFKREDSFQSTDSTVNEPTTIDEFKPPATRFSHIIGHSDVKVRIDELLLPLALPPSVTKNILRGVRSLPASILLYGPPGCGKTQLAQAIAGESQACFLSIGPSDILSKYVGESESSLRELFKRAKYLAKKVDSRCAVIFFDEIDALGCARATADGNSNSQDGDGSRRILAELLIQLTNLSNSEQSKSSREQDDEVSDDGSMPESLSLARVLVVAATNRISDCDPALIRRFAIQIHVGLPKSRDRRKILKKYLLDFQHTLSKGDLEDLTAATEGWSGSDLESLAREAAMTPIRECLKAAAAARRKSRRLEQQGGTDPSEEAAKTEDSFEVAKQEILERIQSLRPVTIEDFQSALDFLLFSSHDGVDQNQYECSTDSSDGHEES